MHAHIHSNTHAYRVLNCHGLNFLLSFLILRIYSHNKLKLYSLDLRQPIPACTSVMHCQLVCTVYINMGSGICEVSSF